MKNIPLLLSCFLSFSACFAKATKVTIHGGTTNQTNAIVNFDLPAGSFTNNTALLMPEGASGASVVVQISTIGHAVCVMPTLAAGETKRFTLQSLDEVASKASVTVEKADHTLIFSTQGKPMFTYQMEAGEVPDGVSKVFQHGAHLHPVYSPSGKLVTGNHPSDHRWHRGIWMAWTHTEFEGQKPDFWNQGKGNGPDNSSDKVLAEVHFDSLEQSWSGPVQGGFVSKHRFIDYNSGKAKDVLLETWEVSAIATGTGDTRMNVIDFVSTQTCAGSSAVHLPKYHYGGLGVRGNQLWNPVDAVTMLTSNGDDRLKGDSTKAKWVHLGGLVDGASTGIVVLIHPQNFRFPQPLRLNPKNPQLCIAPSQDGDWTIEPGKPYVSRYRFLILDGAPSASAIDAAWQSYAEPPTATVE